MSSLKKVFISEPINQKGLEYLEGKVELVHAPDTSKATAIDLIGNCDAAILRATTIFDAEVIKSAKRLKIIARTGVGYNNVDMESASENNIYVTVTPGTNNTTVAEHVVAMIFALGKQILFMDAAVREGKWGDRFSPYQMDIHGKTIGIIGLGAIGLEVAERCASMGMQVLAYDPFFSGSFNGQVVDSLDVLFAESDFITLHCPVTPDTENLISMPVLKMMKPTAYLINTARGVLVNEKDLTEALHKGIIKGAAVDVFQEEPMASGHILASAPNIIFSPHCAGSTVESNERIAVMAAKAVIDALNCKVPQTLVTTW